MADTDPGMITRFIDPDRPQALKGKVFGRLISRAPIESAFRKTGIALTDAFDLDTFDLDTFDLENLTGALEGCFPGNGAGSSDLAITDYQEHTCTGRED